MTTKKSTQQARRRGDNQMFRKIHNEPGREQETWKRMKCHNSCSCIKSYPSRNGTTHLKIQCPLSRISVVTIMLLVALQKQFLFVLQSISTGSCFWCKWNYTWSTAFFIITRQYINVSCPTLILKVFVFAMSADPRWVVVVRNFTALFVPPILD